MTLSRGWWAVAAAGCAGAATYALNDLVADVTGAALSTLRGVAGHYDAPPAPDSSLLIISHEPSVCCEPFIQGLRLVALPAFAGGAPMALAALLTLRLRGRARTMPGRVLARAGLALQIFSVCLWTMALAMAVQAESDISVEFGRPGSIVIGALSALWFGHTLIGILGARAWWRLAEVDPGYVRVEWDHARREHFARDRNR